MPMKTKTFDCVEMKNAVQRTLAEEWKDLSNEQIRQRIHHRLETADDELSRWWRSLRVAQDRSHDNG